MPRRASRRFVAAGFILSLFAASPATAQAIQAADCAKPATAAARTICRSPEVAGADAALVRAERELADLTPRGERPALDDAALAFGERHARVCGTGDAAACATLIQHRRDDIDGPLKAARKTFSAIVAGIAREPNVAAAGLTRYDGAPAAAWMAYLYHAGLVPVADKENAIRRTIRTAMDNSSLADDPYMMEELRNLGDVASGDVGTLLLFLRHVLSATGLDAPCFLFSRHGQPAFEAFGAFWGNRRDATPVVCHGPPSIFDLAEWKAVAKNLDPAVEPALKERGSIRHAYDRQFQVDALQASMVPSTLLEAPLSRLGKRVAGERQRAMAAFRAWKDFQLWPEAGWKATVKALPAALAVTARIYRERFGLTPATADEAARAAAERFIGARLILILPDE
jgi:uncharacterized protein YecT (DUF1311 family)